MSSSVRVRSIDVIEARYRTQVTASVSNAQGSHYFGLYSPEGSEVKLSGIDAITDFLLALGKRCKLDGEWRLSLVVRGQKPDGRGGYEDCAYYLQEYFEKGALLEGVEPLLYW